MEPLRTNNHSSVRVRKEFCHPSYWENDSRKYGELEPNGEFGILYLHKKCDASESYGTQLGEEYEYCEECDTVFSEDEWSAQIYEKTGEILCSHCAREYVQENLGEFLETGLPNFDRPLPSINLSALDVDSNPKIRHAPEDTQGWSANMPVPKSDIGHGSYRDAIKAIVERGNKWLIVIGGANVTHNICAVAVDVYEYNENGFCAFCGGEAQNPSYTPKGKPICDGCREDYSMEIDFGVI